MEEAKASPEPDLKDIWTDIWYKGTELPMMRPQQGGGKLALDHLLVGILTCILLGPHLLNASCI